MSILNRGVEDPDDAPTVGVDSVINLRPDRDVVVRFVPREVRGAAVGRAPRFRRPIAD